MNIRSYFCTVLLCLTVSLSARLDQQSVCELAIVRAHVGKILMGFADDHAERSSRYPWDSFERLDGLLDQYRARLPHRDVVAFSETVKQLLQLHWFQSVARRMRIHQYLQKIVAEHAIDCSGGAVPQEVAAFFKGLSYQEQRALIMNIIRATDYAGT